MVVVDLHARHVYIVDSMSASKIRAKHYANCISRVVEDLLPLPQDIPPIYKELGVTVLDHVPR